MIRHISENGLSLIKQSEGFSSTVYRCPAGYPTIGYGHVLKPDEHFEDGIDEQQAEILLRRDVQVAERAVLHLINVPLTDGEFDALTSFTFNLGAGALQRSTLRRKVNRQEHDDVPAEFVKWVYARGRKLPGLVKRRRLEAMLYRDTFFLNNTINIRSQLITFKRKSVIISATKTTGQLLLTS